MASTVITGINPSEWHKSVKCDECEEHFMVMVGDLIKSGRPPLFSNVYTVCTNPYCKARVYLQVPIVVAKHAREQE